MKLIEKMFKGLMTILGTISIMLIVIFVVIVIKASNQEPIPKVECINIK
jgi:hypothetical protein